MKLDISKPYGTIIGHSIARYEQNGILFQGDGSPVTKIQDTKEIETDDLESAKTFLRNILKETTLAKNTVLKVAEQNNQNWDDVRNAAAAIGVQKLKVNNQEAWKLPE